MSHTSIETRVSGLDKFMTRSLSQDRFVALKIDGKDRQIVPCMGSSKSGAKRITKPCDGCPLKLLTC